jgi:hypothetical protein
MDTKNKYLGFKDLLKLAEQLAPSQGFYGRLLNELEQMNKDDRKELNKLIRKQKLLTPVDLINYIEG